MEYLHNEGYVHCDIKLENIVIGRGKKSKILYLIDYGLCSLYINKKTGAHIPYKEGKTLKGNATFASVNAHLGIGNPFIRIRNKFHFS